MRFNMKKFFEDYNIEYQAEGKNCSSKFLQINCIFCKDTSFHLGAHKFKGYFNCWKCGWHSIYEGIKQLINKKPNEILKEYSSNSDFSFQEFYTNSKEKEQRPRTIEIPGSKEPEKIHLQYLKKRGFDTEYLIEKYDLRFTTYLGSYKWRIIIPIYYNGKIISFQGRDVTGKQELRYKACNQDLEIINHQNILFNLDNCKSNKIVVVEGIFDALKIGDNCCCTFGTGVTDNQITLLKKFKKVFILFDSEETAQVKSFSVGVKLNSLGIDTERIVLTEKSDPGELNEDEVIKLKSKLELF